MNRTAGMIHDYPVHSSKIFLCMGWNRGRQIPEQEAGEFTRSSCSCSRSRSSVPGRRAERVLGQAAAFDGCHVPLTTPVKVVGCGSCGVDYLASVATYPKPDQKLRTDALVVQGGGNCANALTAAARLGLSPTLVTKIGDDGLGDGIMSELQRDGIDTSLVLRAACHPSPFTYIIVDREGGTRTCIHTPGAPTVQDEMSPTLISQALAGASLVYFDGRLTEAALLLARAARAAEIAVLVEGERLRPGLQDLLKEADYVVTSAHFPQEWTGEQCIGDAMLEVAMRLPRARMVITTLGTKGSVCLLRQDQQAATAKRCLQEIIEELSNQTTDSSSRSSDNSSPSKGHVCISSSGVAIQPARVASTSADVRLQFSSSRDSSAAEASAQEAASKAAALNADASNAHGYIRAHHETAGNSCAVAQVFVASAAGLPATAVVDTTGAGDSYIGSVMYGITMGMTPDQIMLLGAAVAACKCTAIGARAGLPTREQLAPQMLAGEKHS